MTLDVHLTNMAIDITADQNILGQTITTKWLK